MRRGHGLEVDVDGLIHLDGIGNLKLKVQRWELNPRNRCPLLGQTCPVDMVDAVQVGLILSCLGASVGQLNWKKKRPRAHPISIASARYCVLTQAPIY